MCSYRVCRARVVALGRQKLVFLFFWICAPFEITLFELGGNKCTWLKISFHDRMSFLVFEGEHELLVAIYFPRSHKVKEKCVFRGITGLTPSPPSQTERAKPGFGRIPFASNLLEVAQYCALWATQQIATLYIPLIGLRSQNQRTQKGFWWAESEGRRQGQSRTRITRKTSYFPSPK